MALPSSGSLSLTDINSEIGASSTATVALNSPTIRALTSTSTDSTIILPNTFYGKSWVPIWNTPAGSIGEGYTQQAQSKSVSASGANSYTIVSGALPSGLSLNSSTGAITGTISAGIVADYSTATYNFTIRATKTNAGSSDRAFSILVRSRYVGILCGTANENGAISISAPSGMVLNRKDFSSYGTPGGSCGAFTYGWCNSGSSNSWNPGIVSSIYVLAANSWWGDPCGGTPKRMYVQMTYGPF